MSTKLLLPAGAVPSNLHFPEGVDVQLVDADMYSISERVCEISPSIHIWKVGDKDPDSDRYGYVLTESCIDGVERLIFKVPDLDARVLHRLKELFSVPLEERVEKLEKENWRFEEAEKEREHEELYEKLGRPMLTQMEHDGFIQRPVSYPKLGVTARGKRAR